MYNTAKDVQFVAEMGTQFFKMNEINLVKLI